MMNTEMLNSIREAEEASHMLFKKSNKVGDTHIVLNFKLVML